MCARVRGEALKVFKVRTGIRYQADQVQVGFHIYHAVMGGRVLMKCHVKTVHTRASITLRTLRTLPRPRFPSLSLLFIDVYLFLLSITIPSLSLSLFLKRTHALTHAHARAVIKMWCFVIAGSIAVLFLQDHLASEANALTATTSLGHYHQPAFS